jgi:LysR family transcriptional regulator of abg operon
MKLHHMRNVIAVVDRGSLRAAAKHLGLAQPAMSRSIRELEQELGVVLFERNKFGMALTKVGELFVRRARGVHAELQRTLDEVEQFRGVDRGTIVVAFSPSTLVALLPTIIAPFRRKFPNVRIKVLEGALPAIETQLRDGLVDLYYGPVAKGFSDAALTIDVLFENRRMIVGRQGHPLQHATSLEQLAGAAWLTPQVDLDSDNEVNSFFESAGLPPPNIVMQASSGMSMVTIVATSDLLAPAPQQWLDVIETTHRLVRIAVRNIPNAPHICAIRRNNMPLTPAAEYMNDLAKRAAVIHAKKRADFD